MEIRDVKKEDIAGIMEIYRYYVEETDITFEYVMPTEEEFTARVEKILEKYPYLVALEDGKVVGYAYAGTFKGRAAYDWAVETTVYVDRNCHGKGIGKALYEELEILLKEQNIQNLNACITFPNKPSEAFHQKMGYRTVAHFEKCGYKLGRWLDMIWMQKFIGEHPDTPAKVVWRNRKL